MNHQIKTARFKKFGPWALVTGASEGIGRAFAENVAQQGLHVVLVARRAELLEEVAFQLGKKYGVKTLVIPTDLAKAEEIERLLLQLESLDIGLFVAAAGFGTSGEFATSVLHDELEMVDVNCRAVTWLAHHFAGRFVKQKRGGMVFLSSVVAFQGVPYASNYAATKAYVQSLAEGLRHELEPHGVTVIACAPGPVASGFASRAKMNMGASASPDEIARGTVAWLHDSGTVRPGALAKILGWSLALLPRVLRVRVMEKIMRGMAINHG